eukprot:gene12332-biopygen27049
MYAAHCERVASRPAAPPEAVVKARVCYAAKGRDIDENALVIYREQEPLLIVDAMANAIKQATDRSASPCKKVTVIVFSAKGTPTNYSHIKLICSSLSNNFPETTARALVFPTNIFSRGNLARRQIFLDPVVREKVVLLCGGRQPPGVSTYLAAENMPERNQPPGDLARRCMYNQLV